MKTQYISIIIAFIVICGLLFGMQYISKRERRALVIIEPRRHKDLSRVLANFDMHIDRSWDLYIFHGAGSASYAANAAKVVKSGRNIYLKSLNTDNLNSAQYNELLKDPIFWDRVDAEDILIFQTDAAICGQSKFRLEDFTSYDYIGCSVKPGLIGDKGKYWNAHFYGIGGLSFRKKSFMKQCIRTHPNKDPTYAEDVFFSECVHNSPHRPQSDITLANFCTQTTHMSNSWGAHKTKHIRLDSSFYDFCPEAKFLAKPI